MLQTLRSELQALIIPSEIAEQGEAAARLLSVLWNLYQSPLSTPLPTASVAEPAADDQDAGECTDHSHDTLYCALMQPACFPLMYFICICPQI